MMRNMQFEVRDQQLREKSLSKINVEKHEHSSPIEGENMKETLHNFVEKTGITLVSYIGTRDNITWKVIWLSVIVAGFTMTIIQSNDAITDYFGYAITLRTTFELNGTMQFPTVTICSNNPINWTNEKYLNSQFYREVMKKIDDENSRQIYTRETTRKTRTYEEYVLLDALSNYYKDNQLINYSTFGILTKLYWNGETYTNRKSVQSKSFKVLEDERTVYRLRDFLQGECIIFNSEIDLRKSLSAAALTGAEFTISWDNHDRYPYINDAAVVVVIHPVGTPPILDDSNNIKVYSGDEVSIAIRQREITRLPPPYPSRCVDRTNLKLQANSVYYQTDRPYLYSMEACIKTCMQKISLDSCLCWDAQIPLGYLKRKYKKSTMCKIDRCPQIDQKLTSKFCGCKLPCRETLLENTLAIKSGIIKEIVKKQFNEVETEEISKTQNTAKVKVFIKSAVYESIKEEPKYTVADFWGIIGGNMGLWIGISAVSLFEVVELSYVILHKKLKKIFKKNTNGNRTKIKPSHPKEANHRKTKINDPNSSKVNELYRSLRNKTYKFVPDI